MVSAGIGYDESTSDDLSELGFDFNVDYVSGKKPEDIFVQRLEKAINEAKRNRKWRHEYMTLAMRDQENFERGFAEGYIKTAYNYGISERWILETLQKELDISLQSAQEYVSRFGQQTV